MDKIKLESSNIADENFEKLASLFPNVVTETIVNDRVERAIDVEKLKQEINAYVLEGNEERYNFTWPDKRKSVVLANTPTRNTLRACKEESKDFDNTENLYIEGDNLEVLKLLRNTYMGQIKMIYIDPPYNTGKDFVYQDNFYINKEEYKEMSGQFDEEGNRLFENTEANGRFHTDWLNMMYPRLKMARDLLSDDGVIFISIDDNEVSNLRKICDEIFGERNFIAQIVWERAFAPVNLKKHFSVSHDYLLFYSKNIELSVCNGLSRSQETNDRYSNPDNDPRGPWTSDNFSVGPAVESNIYEIITPSGRSCLPPNGRSWRVSKDKYFEMLKDNRVWFGEDGNGVPRYKRFLKDVKNSVTPMSIWKYSDVGHSQDATKELKILFDNIHVFDYSKTIELIKRGISLYSDKDSIILDFFSGSATTAHAVMQLNAEDGGNRKYIMVQLPAETPEDSEARKAGYNTICEIGKERIRRAGEKIKKDYPNANIDTGFRVFKLDSSNMEDVYYEAEKFSQQDISKTISYIKADRSEEDLLFQIILSCGIPLKCKIEIKKVN
ncbi:MAG TPA: site-specific DNA-methyltransferase, partial [Candidatus Mucispirillum faecigallinarum]|nr:site-specific DNA-methyltransferase [Candidatus Mucispirillum faecigallinarum]